MRHVLIHHHIFKNAGSSLIAALSKSFGLGFSEFHPINQPDGYVSPRLLVDYLDLNPHIKALSSHHFNGVDFQSKLDASGRERFVFVECVLLRHPVSRLVSMYFYYRGISQVDHPLSEAAKGSSLSDFLWILVRNHPNFSMNPQTTMFGCDHYGAPPSAEDFNRALVRLKKTSLLGVAEKYAETMVVGEYFICPIFKELKLSFFYENTSVKKASCEYDGSLDSVRSVIDKTLYAELCHLNDLDIELWNAVIEELNRRISYVPDFDGRRNEYINRNPLGN